MFAVSKRFTPASRHMSTCRVAPATSVEPTLSNGPLPPKVIVPRVNDETNRPERPRRRYSIYPPEAGTTARASVARPLPGPRGPRAGYTSAHAGAAGKRDDRLRLRLPHRGRPGLRRLRVARGARGALRRARGAGPARRAGACRGVLRLSPDRRGARRGEPGLAHDVAEGVPRSLRGVERVPLWGREACDLP